MMMSNGVYMEQEEEWEREGLLDPAWEKQQRKVKKKNSKPHMCQRDICLPKKCVYIGARLSATVHFIIIFNISFLRVFPRHHFYCCDASFCKGMFIELRAKRAAAARHNAHRPSATSLGFGIKIDVCFSTNSSSNRAPYQTDLLVSE